MAPRNLVNLKSVAKGYASRSVNRDASTYAGIVIGSA
jgi:hypothetical protein